MRLTTIQRSNDKRSTDTGARREGPASPGCPLTRPRRSVSSVLSEAARNLLDDAVMVERCCAKIILALTIVSGGLLIGAAAAPEPPSSARLEIGPGASIRGPVTFRRSDGSVALQIASEVVFGDIIEFQ